MGRFRYPDGWNTRRFPGQRPELKGSWLDPARAPGPEASYNHRHSYEYWTKIHWATPPWMLERYWDEVREIYDKANPAFDHVDHIVPLKHPLVCGLHVPWNLQVISKTENIRKSNNYWPDCPDHLCPDKNLPQDMFFDLPSFGPPHQQHQMSLPL